MFLIQKKTSVDKFARAEVNRHVTPKPTTRVAEPRMSCFAFGCLPRKKSVEKED
jgi:hypothetical protein